MLTFITSYLSMPMPRFAYHTVEFFNFKDNFFTFPATPLWMGLTEAGRMPLFFRVSPLPSLSNTAPYSH